MDKLLEDLNNLGFKEYESKVFLALLKGGIMGASEIAEKANITRTFVYEILKNFCSRGYCNEIETNKVTNYQIIDPRIITDKIKNEFTESHTRKIAHLENTFDKLFPLYKSEQTEESKIVNVELIRGYNTHREVKFIELFKKAKEEVLFMIRLEGFVSGEIDDVAKNFFKKGGKIKSIYQASTGFKILKDDTWSTVTIEDLLKICEGYASYGEEVRISDDVLPNMTIFDREIVFTNIKDRSIPRHNESDIIIKNKDHAKHMIDLFDTYWNRAFTTEQYRKNKRRGKRYVKPSKV